ncbi:hypothetical protein FRZ67_15230 [Panacibacter ginsenosidivorans]|uniref:Gliding motility protein RemB n=1 Tax=Panacibacter ginsenosidivorans TaxID=1813871 RepID=A0A5B8VAX0_9BACT|nr:hypothetical protein FRZ67_15230 [Panacibacter ginsenosidivorans]
MKNILQHFLPFFISVLACLNSSAQAPAMLLTNSYNEQRIVYNDDSLLHTAWRPMLYTDSTAAAAKGPWFNRKFFKEHLVQVRDKDFNLNADIIFDEYIGNSKRPIKPNTPGIQKTSNTPMINTRGYEISGNVSDKFYFETAFYENQGRFGGYVDSFIRGSRVIPGQSAYKNVGDGFGFDFSNSEARLMYKPSKYFLFDLGYGKNFIGDGYRSMLLSDWAYNYPYFKTSINLGKFQYNFMWSQYISDRDPTLNNYDEQFRKWSQTFLIDWKATKHLSVSLFETVMWPDQDSMRRSDRSAWIASPIIFLHGSKSPAGVNNNVIVGTNLKYQLFKHTTLYGQFAADQLGDAGSWQTRYAIQAGIRSGNLFNINNLNGLIEFNTARPYMYATNSLNTNYAQLKQPLAHPRGANFKEGLVLVDYSIKRWYFRAEGFVTKYGADSSAATNYGSDIFKPVSTRTVSNDVKTGQGVSTNILYGDLRIAYIINPVTNMRIETGFTYRNEKSDLFNYRDRIFYIGIRMSFRKISYDF